MKDTFVIFTATKNENFKNCLTRINLFQCTIKICKSLQQKCIKSNKRVIPERFCVQKAAQRNYFVPYYSLFITCSWRGETKGNKRGETRVEINAVKNAIKNVHKEIFYVDYAKIFCML